ncbi:MAG TPA: hypothetical protein VF600_19130 [Abditibacteriaceae bacterium]|jgi:hypothetical protein
MDIVQAIFRIDPTAEYRLTDAGAQTADDILDWRSSSTPKPTQAQLDAAWQEIETARIAEETQRAATRSQLTASAQPLVGQSINALDDSDRVALLNILLWNANALSNGLIKPLEEWMMDES